MQTTTLESRFRHVGAAIALSAATVVAAGPQPHPAADPTPITPFSEEARVRLVLLPTVVTDRRGQPVRDLTAEAFTLYEEGVPQRIDVFASEQDAPISLAFLLDVSESMGLRDQLGQAQRAIRSIVEGLAPKDRYALIGFADEQVSWITPFTDDRERFLRRLDVQDPGGRTALYDALARTPAMVGQGSGERRAVLLFTDGLDNASTIPKLQALWMARQVQVPIYALSFVPMRPDLLPERVRDSLTVLGQFAEETGGGLAAIYLQEDLDAAVARIQEDLRQQYVIGYYSAADDDDRSFRRIRLIASNPRWTVRTRTGYYP